MAMAEIVDVVVAKGDQTMEMEMEMEMEVVEMVFEVANGDGHWSAMEIARNGVVGDGGGDGDGDGDRNHLYIYCLSPQFHDSNPTSHVDSNDYDHHHVGDGIGVDDSTCLVHGRDEDVGAMPYSQPTCQIVVVHNCTSPSPSPSPTPISVAGG